MSPAFQTGRRSALLTRRLKHVRRRRRAILALAVAVSIPAFIFLLIGYLERSGQFLETPPPREEADFDPQLVYAKARALLESGRSNEHRGRRELVKGQFEEALDLMLLISERDPEYRPAVIRQDIEFLRGKLRKVR